MTSSKRRSPARIAASIKAAHEFGPVYTHDAQYLPLTPPSQYEIYAAKAKKHINSVKHFGVRTHRIR